MLSRRESGYMSKVQRKSTKILNYDFAINLLKRKRGGKNLISEQTNLNITKKDSRNSFVILPL